jgi:hypothetical protein
LSWQQKLSFHGLLLLLLLPQGMGAWTIALLI